jgi:4-oxalocrotonate tautomerase
MQHVSVKLWPAKPAEQKQRVSDAISGNMMEILNDGEDAVSVAFEEVAREDWTEQVFKPEILGKWNQLIKEPAYGPAAS